MLYRRQRCFRQRRGDEGEQWREAAHFGLSAPASCVSVCACQAGSAPGRADRRRQRATARGRLTPSAGTPRAESHRRRYRRRTARSSEAATDRARWIGSRNVISTRVRFVFLRFRFSCVAVLARACVCPVCLSLPLLFFDVTLFISDSATVCHTAPRSASAALSGLRSAHSGRAPGLRARELKVKRLASRRRDKHRKRIVIQNGSSAC